MRNPPRQSLSRLDGGSRVHPEGVVHALPERKLGGVLWARLFGRVVQIGEDAAAGQSARLRESQAGQDFGDCVEMADPACDVRAESRIADGGKGEQCKFAGRQGTFMRHFVRVR